MKAVNRFRVVSVRFLGCCALMLMRLYCCQGSVRACVYVCVCVSHGVLCGLAGLLSHWQKPIHSWHTLQVDVPGEGRIELKLRIFVSNSDDSKVGDLISQLRFQLRFQVEAPRPDIH